MLERKSYSTLKIGLLIVAISYFLFTLHALFTLQWIGEWEYLGGGSGFSTMIFVEDINATIGLVFRFVASFMALASVIYYFSKKSLSAQTATKTMRWILVFEGIYWLGLVTTGAYSVYYFLNPRDPSIESILTSLSLSVIPVLLESVILPIALFITAYKLSPNKPMKGAIKWSLITGTIYILVFWLINSSIWISVVSGPTQFYTGAENGALYPYTGMDYLVMYPDQALSFSYTIVGLIVIALFATYLVKTSLGTETWRNLPLRRIGAAITLLGFYFLLIYVMWLVWGTNNQLVLINSVPQVLDVKWNSWFAWFLGHNMDLWMFSLPLVGLPLLFERKTSQ